MSHAARCKGRVRPRSCSPALAGCPGEVWWINPVSLVLILHFGALWRVSRFFPSPSCGSLHQLQEAQHTFPGLAAGKGMGCKACSQKYPEEASRSLPSRNWVPEAEPSPQLPAKARAVCHRDGNSSQRPVWSKSKSSTGRAGERLPALLAPPSTSWGSLPCFWGSST